MPATQKIFALARPLDAVGWAELVPLMQLEAAHVWSLYERGIARDAWVRTDALGVVYVLESTPAEAERLLARHPMASCGLVDFEIVPVGPFTPLSLLFGTRRRPVPATPVRRARGCSQRVLALTHSHEGVTDDELAAHSAEDALHAWGLCKGGVIRETYLRTDRPGAALVLEVGDVDDAQGILAGLPLVRLGLTEFECQSVAAFMGFDALLEGALDA